MVNLTAMKAIPNGCCWQVEVFDVIFHILKKIATYNSKFKTFFFPISELSASYLLFIVSKDIYSCRLNWKIEENLSAVLAEF